MQERKTGILFPIFSLFGEYGIGNFSENAKYFIDLIKEMGFSYWQVLPLTSIGLGNSPYDSNSAFAGNTMFISPNELHKHCLLSNNDLEEAKFYGDKFLVDYDFVKGNSKEFLEKSYLNINEELLENIKIFNQKYNFWLNDYCLYLALLEKYNVETWQDFPKEIKYRDTKALENEEIELENRINFYKYCQYMFFTQWFELKQYANKKGIKIIGDMPFYVSLNSCDVWVNPKYFKLNKDLVPKKVAGVPPDYFCKEGQKWNYPLYNFKEMSKNNYKWFKKRFAMQMEMYDVVRLDHFRAYDSYYAIPFKDENAINGKWEKGVGKNLLPDLVKKYGSKRFIAEDLGTITKNVEKLLKELNIKGMSVFQFGFDGLDNLNLPHNYNENRVVYTGTHDNTTTLGWLYELDTKTRQNVFDYINFKNVAWGQGGKKNTSVKAIIRMLYMSNASIVILPIQDILAYGNDTRINIPGIGKNNWRFRLTIDSFNDADFDYFKKLTTMYFRG